MGTIRVQPFGAFLFSFQPKQALTMLFFLLIKLSERGSRLTGPCLAGRQRVNGPELNRRHLCAASSLCSPPYHHHHGSFQDDCLCLGDLYNGKNDTPRSQSWPQRAAPWNEDFTALGRIRALPRFQGWLFLLSYSVPGWMYVPTWRCSNVMYAGMHLL